MLRVHSLGGGGRDGGDDLSFVLSRRRGVVVRPYSLPPVEGDGEAGDKGVEIEGGGRATKVDIEF